MNKKLHMYVIVLLMSIIASPYVFGQTMFEVQAVPAVSQTMRISSSSLRSTEQTAWPDSVLVFTPDGRKIGKNLFFYDEENNLTCRQDWALLADGRVKEWYTVKYKYDGDIITASTYVLNGQVSETPLFVRRSHKTKKILPYVDAGRVYIYSPSHLVWSVEGDSFEEAYDNRGNLISLITHDKEYKLYKVDIVYDDKNNPIQMEWKDADKDDEVGVIPRKEVFRWDNKGNVIYRETWDWDNGELKLNYSTSCEFTYDSYGNETFIEKGFFKTVKILYTPGITPQMQEYIWENNNWVLESYEVYYPHTSSSLESNNNDPVGDDNKGNFDIIVNIPTDSLAGGSFVINLPDGFMLDADNTKLTVDFNQFELLITKQEGNAWKLEIKSKAFKSASVQSQNTSTILANIAYVVDNELEKGDYDIAVKNIQFTTPTGNQIFEPEMTVPVLLDRTATGTETIQAAQVKVFSEGNSLIIDSPLSETIEVYSITGAKLYHDMKPAGKITVQIPELPGKLLIIKGSSNWVKKVMMK